MLGLSWAEILFLFIVVILCVDPKDIPAFTRKVAGYIRKFKNATREITEVITKELEEPKKYIKDLDGKLQKTYDISDIKPVAEPEKKEGE